MNTVNSLFLSHGAPDEVLHDGPARQGWDRLGDELAHVQRVVVMSAHDEALGFRVRAPERFETVYDFGPGFDRRLRSITYRPAGDAELAGEVLDRLGKSDVSHHTATGNGLDHGAWTVLSRLFSRADRTVVAVSVDRNGGPVDHLEAGRALAGLGDDVLVLGTGALTHRLAAVDWRDRHAAPTPEVTAFSQWMRERCEAGDVESVLGYRERAPFAVWNHPTDEHLQPLFFALGASGARSRVQWLPAGVSHAAIAMDGVSFATQLAA